MSSWQMHGVAAFTRLVHRRKFTSEDAGLRSLARPKGPSSPPAALRRRFPVTVSDTFTFPVYEVKAGGPAVVIYLHGGAYSSEIVGEHWSLISYLAARTGCDVLVPIYGLAPAHHGLEALEFVKQVIEAQDRPVYLAGDSAGGGLALLAAQTCAGVTGLTVLAPWLDLAMDNPGIEAIEPYDPWLARPGLRPIAAAWANGLNLKDPRLSPIHGDLSALPPLQLLVGTRDITLADCRTLRDRLPSTVELTYHEEPGALHVYPLLPVPEARGGRQMIANHVRASVARVA
ncbi:alpha/beta hydrolase fold domain-containing protein [Actinoplanes sp. HUAS TT8]|uniref:alpha/beta hydrolase fold domain-containing protein n=1 Tax=Actinoplanes sp. HUAS TT8 TaxID=3447453 RepID=UPI003F51B248